MRDIETEPSLLALMRKALRDMAAEIGLVAGLLGAILLLGLLGVVGILPVAR